MTTLENKIAKLESGYGAAYFSTGMAATISVISGTMNAGDHCVITECSYGGTNRACREMFAALGISFDFVDFTDVKTIEVTRAQNLLIPTLHLLYFVDFTDVKTDEVTRTQTYSFLLHTCPLLTRTHSYLLLLHVTRLLYTVSPRRTSSRT